MGKAIFNIVFACSSAGLAVSADVKCRYKLLICCKMEVITVECFVKFVKSWLENGGRVGGTGKSVFGKGDLGLENGHVGLGNAVFVFGNVKCGVGLFCFGVGNGKWRIENGGVPVGLSCFRVWFCVFYDCFSGSYEEDKQDYGA